MSPRYIICGCKSWNKRVFENSISKLEGEWSFFSQKEELNLKKLNQINPQKIFFLHWSWIVPNSILKKYECINFHMTDVPYGRGGSPLQNLIISGHKDTKLSALKMTSELDGGPVYLKTPMSLKGTAQEILERSSEIAVGMIEKIIKEHIQPCAQKGDIVLFERRTPEQSQIPEGLKSEELYDFIRMLDGEGYPPAYTKFGGFRYEYSSAVLYNGHLEAKVKIIPE